MKSVRRDIYPPDFYHALLFIWVASGERESDFYYSRNRYSIYPIYASLCRQLVGITNNVLGGINSKWP